MENKIKNIILEIKGKKNKGIVNEYVYNLGYKYFNNDYFNDLFQKDLKLIFKNKKFKEITKIIRKELYSSYGLYQVKKQWKKELLLNDLKNNQDLQKGSIEILRLHSSSRERLNEYKKIYSEIFRITSKPKIIIDLACGLNPCSLVLINFKGNCFAYDIGNEIEFLNKYFEVVKKFGLNGKAFIKDITSDFNFKKGDICLLFKFLDLIKDRVNFFKNLIKSLKCKYLIVSFSKKTISLKNMKQVERKWFNNLLKKLHLKYSLLDFENESFYVIRL